MKSQTSLVASQVRLHEWAMQIRDCQNRPAGMDVTTWCAQQGITKANYYYRFKRVREACIEMAGQKGLPDFVELEPPTETPAPSEQNSSCSATIILTSGVRIELQENASPDFISKLLGVVSHVQ